MGDMALFAATTPAEFIQPCDALIYFGKNKQEACFQLDDLCTHLAAGSQILSLAKTVVVSRRIHYGRIASLQKIDSARRCGLYYGELEQPTTFDIARWWRHYQIDNVRINALPGVFAIMSLISVVIYCYQR